MSASGSLFIVATPIGNLADITYRAVAVLRSVDLIAAEDTRHSKKLLAHYGITTKTLSLHEHNEKWRLEQIVQQLKGGKNIALIADAGTPLISDPGYKLVNKLHQLNLSIVPIPGPCAAIAALSASGLPTDRFMFEGFLTVKKSVRRQRLQALVDEPRTIIFYESVHRIVAFIEMMIEVFTQERIAVIARELTKTYETIYQAPLGELLLWLKNNQNQQKGEFVVLLQGASPRTEDAKMAEYKRVLPVLLAELPVKQAVAITAQLTAGQRKAIYQLALQLKSKQKE